MKRYSYRLRFGDAVLALGILTSCAAQSTTVVKPPTQSATAATTGLSETRDRNTFRDDQSAAPRVNNAPLDP